MVTFTRIGFLLLQLSYVFADSQTRYNKGTPHDVEDCMFNICERVANYPEAEVSNLIQKHSALQSYFGGRIIQPSRVMSLGSRYYDEGPTPFCETKDVSVVPRQMSDIDGATRIIANVEGFSQVVTYQVCRYENGGHCGLESIVGFKATCLQKFNDIKLVTVNYPDEGLEFRTFSIPSTCVCTYTRIDVFI